MCEPTSIVMGATSMMGASAQASAAQQSAQARGDYNYQLALWRNERFQQAVDYQSELAEWQEDRYYKTAASLESSTRGQYAAILEQADQVRAKTLQRLSKGSREAQAASAFIRTSAAETGTTGSSIRLVQQRAELAEARLTHIGFTNLRSTLRQQERSLGGIHAQAQNVLEGAMPQPMAPIDPVQPTQQVVAPSTTPYMMQGLSGAVGAWAWQEQMDLLG